MATNTRLYPTLKKAFAQFVELVRDLPEVCHVVGECPPPHLHTYIKRRDDDVMLKVFRAEDKVQAAYPDLGMEFHIWFMDGRSSSDFASATSDLIYSRRPDAE